jgi:hypothetical protein
LGAGVLSPYVTLLDCIALERIMGESGSRWKQVDESRQINGSRCEAVGSEWMEALEVLVGNKDSGPSLQKASELHHAFQRKLSSHPHLWLAQTSLTSCAPLLGKYDQVLTHSERGDALWKLLVESGSPTLVSDEL